MQVQRKRKGRESTADLRVGYFPDAEPDLAAGAGGGEAGELQKARACDLEGEVNYC